jgi:5-methyltetrahydrofolate--homocysteine methyltransferase
MSEFTALTEAIIKGNRLEAKKQTQNLLDGGMKPDAIVDKGLVPGMAVVGERFKCNEAFVPEMLIAARAMKESMALLEPLLVKAGVTPKYKAVIGTVQGDLHDIGKNLVGMMLKGANIGVVDLGTNVPAATFIAAAKEHRADVIGLSALLTTTMPAMRETVENVKKDAAMANVKVVIGGAPISQIFADEIGADGFAPDAASAVDEVLRVVAAVAR